MLGVDVGRGVAVGLGVLVAVGSGVKVAGGVSVAGMEVAVGSGVGWAQAERIKHAMIKSDQSAYEVCFIFILPKFVIWVNYPNLWNIAVLPAVLPLRQRDVRHPPGRAD